MRAPRPQTRGPRPGTIRPASGGDGRRSRGTKAPVAS
jgi:hypothetical protein